VSFEDESPLFIGAAVYTADGMFECYEVEYEEIIEIMKERIEDFDDIWHEDEDCLISEGYEFMYDLISELQSAFIEDCLIDIRDERSEITSIV
jgi:hypothetical protein